MVRTHQSSHSVFRSILTRHGGLKARNDTGVFYIGLGDQFDDDRRLVLEATSASRPAQPLTAVSGQKPFNLMRAGGPSLMRENQRQSPRVA